MTKLIAPNVTSGDDLASAIKRIYRDLNMIYESISKDEKKTKSSDSRGKAGDIKITTTGTKNYLEGKGDNGWSRVEMFEDISALEARIAVLETT